MSADEDRKRENMCLIKKDKMCTERDTWLSCTSMFKHTFIFC